MLNTANILTLSRIAAIPLVVACFWLDRGWSQWLSMGLFVAAGITDYFDGYFARRYHQISRLGRFLDPIADKLLVAAALVMLVQQHGPLSGIHVLAALIILAREILVSGLREFLAELRVSVPVTRLAKWKTTAQLVAVGFLLAGPAGEAILPGTTAIGLALLWVSAVVTLYTGYDYFRTGVQHLLEEQ
jgi:cardiolipin synthase